MVSPNEWDRALTELQAAQARIAELEAQAATLAGVLRDADFAWDRGEMEEMWRIVHEARGNLPQAVQRHIARDKAVEGMAKAFDNLFNHPAPDAAGRMMQWTRAGESFDAYRAASGEEKERVTTNLHIWSNVGSTAEVYECCICTKTDVHRMVIIERPLYASVFICPDCSHGVCATHWMPCGLCYACCWEVHGNHQWETRDGQ